jgi:hypothetical protein
MLVSYTPDFRENWQPMEEAPSLGETLWCINNANVTLEFSAKQHTRLSKEDTEI